MPHATPEGDPQSPASRKPKKPRNPLPALIKQYYADLKDLAHQNVLYEMGTRTAFHNLLAGAAKPHAWTLIPELEKRVNGRTIRPDGTFKDQMNLVRGHWEAKDPGDDLPAEIAKKKKAGYPFTNIIFEDNRTAVLFQNDKQVMTADMTDPAQLEPLILEFFRHVEPEIQQFEHAVDEFKTRVPELAEGLVKQIKEAHRTNTKFKTAFAAFLDLCRASLNPNLSEAAVDEMLVQHILTERVIREVFGDSDFDRRNAIAVEVEKVVDALAGQSFNRKQFLASLDRFYLAIEHAARTMPEFEDKQHFLNTVYERFFQGYSVKLADTMGIVYTPQAIVDFMCASVEEVLKTEFGKTLASDDVYIIDPCTGTGNFIVNLIKRIPKSKIEDVYKKRLFANEIMLLPYYIAALNIEHAYYEQTGTYETFEGLCFVDTLDMAEHPQSELGFMTAKNSERVERQRKSPITVVIGNPPYNMHQQSENDNNKNRAYPVIDNRIRDTFAKDGTASNKNGLRDAYVKFFRWAIDRLGDRDGVICFVTNNSFVDQIAFDGMRKHLAAEFQRVYHVDLEGNVRHDPKLAGTTYNVFGIQVGVGVTVAVRRRHHATSQIFYARVDKLLRKEAKLSWLAEHKALGRLQWKELTPDEKNTWLVPENAAQFESLVPIASRETKSSQASDVPVIFKTYGRGVATCRDDTVYDFQREPLTARVKKFIEDYNGEVDRYRRSAKDQPIDSFVDYTKVKWSRDLKADVKRQKYAEFREEKLRQALYRPFCRRLLFLDRILNEEVYVFPEIFPNADAERENIVIALTDLGSEKPFMVMVSSGVADLHLVGAGASCQCFPFYTYSEDGSNRTENITDWALAQFRSHYNDPSIDKWAIFHYVYGLLHHPAYRTKFADNLKRELPRIPFAPDFRAFSEAGKKLAALHLDYEKLEPHPLDFVESPDHPLSWRVEDKMRLSKDKTRLTINPSLTLANIPPQTFDYRLGNRSALDWVIDQYQLHTDPRSNITSDPNRPEDPQYITRLIGQVIRVSLETVAIINALPAAFAPLPDA